MTNPVLLLGAAVGYGLLMSTHPIRGSLRDGLRCVRRYKQVWGVLAFCGIAAALFLFALQYYEWWTVPGAPPAVTPWIGWRPVVMEEVAATSGVPTLLSVAALFDCLVSLFPVSVLAAALFLVNWRGYQGVLLRGVTRRCGVAGGLGIHFGLICCAVASLAKPLLLFGQADLLAVRLDARELALASGLIYWLSFAFEYFLGILVQSYLALLCLVWVRGLTFNFDALRRFALRRFGFVVKWAALVLAVSSIGINLPVVVQSVLDDQRVWLARTVACSQVVLPLILLGFCSMQLTLLFHNESLRQAFADHGRFLRRHAGPVLWLILIAGIHFFLLSLANGFLGAAGGTSTWPLLGWRLLVYPVLWSALGAWFLASWVCLFRRCEQNRPDEDELVQF